MPSRPNIFDELAGRLEGLKSVFEKRETVIQDTLFNSSEALVIASALPALFVDIETGEILYATRRAEEMFGYFVVGELAGKPVDDLVPDTLRKAHLQHRANFAKQPRQRLMGSRETELRGLRANGEIFPVEIDLSAMVLSNRRCVMAVIFDMTNRIRANDSQ